MTKKDPRQTYCCECWALIPLGHPKIGTARGWVCAACEYGRLNQSVPTENGCAR